MYRAFNVRLNFDALSKYNPSKKIYEQEKEESKDKLIKLIASNKKIAASEIKQLILPIQPYDIFLSHSHNDLDLALKLKNYLETVFGLTVFIDSVYWDNINDLQEVLNEYHHNRENDLFNHQKTMQVAAHANLILASALTEMIDCCESVFFLNTNNSVISGRDVVYGNNATYSPWIYHEVYTTTIIKPKLKRFKAAFEHRDSASVLNESMPQIEYDLNLDKMELLNLDKLSMWHHAFLRDNKVNPLDILYNLTKYCN